MAIIACAAFRYTACAAHVVTSLVIYVEKSSKTDGSFQVTMHEFTKIKFLVRDLPALSTTLTLFPVAVVFNKNT